MSSKLREALEEIIDTINKWRTNGALEHWQYSHLFDIADTALAEPLRNCDVGDANEQESRFRKYCGSNYNSNDVDAECWRCPLYKHRGDCVFAWMQMPYKKGDAQ